MASTAMLRQVKVTNLVPTSQFLMYSNSRENSLFSGQNWFDVAENIKQKLKAEVASIDGDRLLNTSVDDLCDYLVEKYSIDIPTLRRDEILADQRETQIDVRNMPNSFARYTGYAAPVPGIEVEILVPFDGDGSVFKIQPTSWTSMPLIANVLSGNLSMVSRGANLNAGEIRTNTDRTLDGIESYLATIRRDAASLALALQSIARQSIEKRRQSLLSNQNLVASLGFNLRERTDAPKTYTALEVRRKITPKPPAASTKPYEPEPTLDLANYDHILAVIQSMVTVMERSPSAFVSMDEEALRTHFLVQLNGHYDGQATGETFNYEGKTDILIRSDGKNIFIGECKFWSGAKKLTETIDQLLGYSSWRDTKVAIIIFSRNKDFSNVLSVLDETTKSHPNFKRTLSQQSETSFRYVFAHRDDPNREMILTAMAFDVPK